MSTLVSSVVSFFLLSFGGGGGNKEARAPYRNHKHKHPPPKKNVYRYREMRSVVYGGGGGLHPLNASTHDTQLSVPFPCWGLFLLKVLWRLFFICVTVSFIYSIIWIKSSLISNKSKYLTVDFSEDNFVTLQRRWRLSFPLVSFTMVIRSLPSFCLHDEARTVHSLQHACAR